MRRSWKWPYLLLIDQVKRGYDAAGLDEDPSIDLYLVVPRRSVGRRDKTNSLVADGGRWSSTSARPTVTFEPHSDALDCGLVRVSTDEHHPNIERLDCLAPDEPGR
jgi:hypothetical protein